MLKNRFAKPDVRLENLSLNAGKANPPTLGLPFSLGTITALNSLVFLSSKPITPSLPTTFLYLFCLGIVTTAIAIAENNEGDDC